MKLKQDNRKRVDFEFTLALNNATGKYFICQEVIDNCKDLIQNVWYWHAPLKRLPPRLIARILGRLALLEVNFRAQSRFARFLPQLRLKRPLVFTDPRETLLYKLKGNDIVLCHDMGPVTHADLYDPLTRLTYETAFDKIKKAKPFMVFVSRSSQKSFAALYGKDYPFMEVIYPPLRLGVAGGAEEPIEGAPQRFLLSVGAVGWRKNYLRSLEAFQKSKLGDEGFHYVICGGPEPGFEAVAEVAARTPNVITTGYVSDSQLRWLYAHASGFVLPSLLEGFGLPAAEAISRGLVPLLSTDSALHEVAGDSAILVDPLDVDAIAEGMRQLAYMGEGERRARLQDLQQSISRFSRESAMAAWRSTLQAALAV